MECMSILMLNVATPVKSCRLPASQTVVQQRSTDLSQQLI